MTIKMYDILTETISDANDLNNLGPIRYESPTYGTVHVVPQPIITHYDLALSFIFTIGLPDNIPPTLINDLTLEVCDEMKKYISKELIYVLEVSVINVHMEYKSNLISIMDYINQALKNEYIYGRPRMIDIMQGSYKFPVIQTPPTFGVDFKRWIDIKDNKLRKIYDAVKKGTIDGTSYMLGPLQPFVIHKSGDFTLHNNMLNTDFKMAFDAPLIYITDVDKIHDVIGKLIMRIHKMGVDEVVIKDKIPSRKNIGDLINPPS